MWETGGSGRRAVLHQPGHHRPFQATGRHLGCEAQELDPENAAEGLRLPPAWAHGTDRPPRPIYTGWLLILNTVQSPGKITSLVHTYSDGGEQGTAKPGQIVRRGGLKAWSRDGRERGWAAELEPGAAAEHVGRFWPSWHTLRPVTALGSGDACRPRGLCPLFFSPSTGSHCAG